MERQREIKILSMVALVVAIVGMSLGFAAFSATLNISSSASVSPSSSSFDVRLCSKQNGCLWDMDMFVYPSATNGATYNVGIINSHYIDSIVAKFSNSNQSVIYTFYAHNIGEYDAYLNSIEYIALDNGTYKKCKSATTDSTKATDSLVQAACEGINVTVSVGGTSYEFGSNISGHKLPKGTAEEVQLKIEYVAGATLADGPFNVDISKFKLNYSTVDDSSKNIINFTIKGESYQAEEGMTWMQWIESPYNTFGFSTYEDTVVTSTGMYVFDSKNYYVLVYDVIIANEAYFFSSGGFSGQ